MEFQQPARLKGFWEKLTMRNKGIQKVVKKEENKIQSGLRQINDMELKMRPEKRH